jgi:hypothetical protein
VWCGVVCVNFDGLVRVFASLCGICYVRFIL